MGTPTELELQHLFNRATSRVAADRVAPVSDAFRTGFVAAVALGKAAVSKGDRAAPATPDFDVPPALDLQVGDYVWFYELGATRRIVDVINRNAMTPPTPGDGGGGDGSTVRAIVYNVLDYQATGDGATDDTEAIQAALDACHAAGGGTVFFPAGTYVTGQLRIPNLVALEGAARPHFSEPGDAVQSELKLKDNANASLLFVALGGRGITVRRLALNGNKANNSGTSHGVEFQSATKLIPLTTSADADDILHSTIDHGLEVNRRIQFLQLIGGSNIDTNTLYYVIAANLAARTFQVSLTAGGAAVSLGSNITGGYVTDINIANHSGRSEVDDCYIFNTQTDGVHIGIGFLATRVANTWFDSCGQDGIRVASTDCRIESCAIGRSGRYNIWISSGLTKINGCDIWGAINNVRVEDISDGGYGGGAGSISLQGCVIQGALEDGIYIGTPPLLAGGVLISSCIFDGSSLGSPGTYGHVANLSGSPSSVMGCTFGDSFGGPNAGYIYRLGATGLIYTVGNIGSGAQATTDGAPTQIRNNLGGNTHVNNDGSIVFGGNDTTALYEETPGVLRIYASDGALGIGDDGARIYSGTGAPSNSIGRDGDFFLRYGTPTTANQRLYAKSGGAWAGIL